MVIEVLGCMLGVLEEEIVLLDQGFNLCLLLLSE